MNAPIKSLNEISRAAFTQQKLEKKRRIKTNFASAAGIDRLVFIHNWLSNF